MAKIGQPVRSPLKSLPEPFVLPFAKVAQSGSFVVLSGVPVQERGCLCLLMDGDGDTLCGGSAIRHAHASNRYERADVHGAESRVLPGMRAHVNGADGSHAQINGRLLNGLKRTSERDDGPVVICIRFNTEHGDARRRCSNVRNGFDGRKVTPFGDVWNAFNDVLHDREGLLPPSLKVRNFTRTSPQGRVVHPRGHAW